MRDELFADPGALVFGHHGQVREVGGEGEVGHGAGDADKPLPVPGADDDTGTIDHALQTRQVVYGTCQAGTPKYVRELLRRDRCVGAVVDRHAVHSLPGGGARQTSEGGGGCDWCYLTTGASRS